MAEITKYIEKLVFERGADKDLTKDESSRVFQIIAGNGATPAQIASILTALSSKGQFSSDEISGAVIAMRNKMIELKLDPEISDLIVDNCGTGGDKKGTYNISTAASFVISAAGAPVTKHGNRSVSSKSGSADVLEELGVNLELSAQESLECLKKAGICFLFARMFHPAMKIVAPIRQELEIKTIFNILGPILNPAKPRRQVLGVYSKELLKPIAETLLELGHKHALVVHGADGLDEISISDETYVSELKNGKILNYNISPKDYGLKIHNQTELIGGDAKINSIAMLDVLSDKESAYKDAVIINAGAGIYVAGIADSIAEGIKIAKEKISNGEAKEKLKKLIELTNSFP